MMKVFTRVGTVLLLVATAGCGAADQNTPTAEDILKALEGEWTVVALDRSGKKSGPDALRDASVTVEKDQFRLIEMKARSAGSGPVTAVKDVFTDEFVLQVDPTKPAGEIDFVSSRGDNLGRTRHGLYALEGDRLTICLADYGDPRPAALAAGGKTMFLVLKRGA